MKLGVSREVLGGVLGVAGPCALLPGWTRRAAGRESEAQVHLGSSGPDRSLRDCGGASRGSCWSHWGGTARAPWDWGWALTPGDPHTLCLLACCPEVGLQGRDGTPPGHRVIIWSGGETGSGGCREGPCLGTGWLVPGSDPWLPWPLAQTRLLSGPRSSFVRSLVTAPWPHSGSRGRGLCERVLRCPWGAGGRGTPHSSGQEDGPARKHTLSFFLTFCPCCSHGPLQGTPLRVVGGWGGPTVGPHPGTPAPHTPGLSSAQRLTPRRGGWLGSGSPQQARPTLPGNGLQGLGLLVTLRGRRPEPHPRVSWRLCQAAPSGSLFSPCHPQALTRFRAYMAKPHGIGVPGARGGTLRPAAGPGKCLGGGGHTQLDRAEWQQGKGSSSSGAWL